MSDHARGPDQLERYIERLDFERDCDQKRIDDFVVAVTENPYLACNDTKFFDAAANLEQIAVLRRQIEWVRTGGHESDRGRELTVTERIGSAMDKMDREAAWAVSRSLGSSNPQELAYAKVWSAWYSNPYRFGRRRSALETAIRTLDVA